MGLPQCRVSVGGALHLSAQRACGVWLFCLKWRPGEPTLRLPPEKRRCLRAAAEWTPSAGVPLLASALRNRNRTAPQTGIAQRPLVVPMAPNNGSPGFPQATPGGHSVQDGRPPVSLDPKSPGQTPVLGPRLDPNWALGGEKTFLQLR